MEDKNEIKWCQCKHTPEEKDKVCQVACICKKCGKPIKHPPSKEEASK